MTHLTWSQATLVLILFSLASFSIYLLIVERKPPRNRRLRPPDLTATRRNGGETRWRSDLNNRK